ncbi:hypothetical protein MANES_01G007050v8 [Manihot esculenta]|uniref:Uncharacterized protein n=1 Tax=Manihot esculenta TaxID=3983 RepID=A0ACB7IB98_MANES|nr:hypothetical protein MANES_01G007050v8 [Manihot esculenta]
MSFPSSSQPQTQNPQPILPSNPGSLNSIPISTSGILPKPLPLTLHTIYLENFPTSCDDAFLLKIKSNYVKISDVYVARKLNKKGKCFAFLWVFSISDMLFLLKTLNLLWIGTYKLKAFKSRFMKNHNGRNQNQLSHQSLCKTRLLQNLRNICIFIIPKSRSCKKKPKSTAPFDICPWYR